MNVNHFMKIEFYLFLFAIIIHFGSTPVFALTPQQKIQYVEAAARGAKDSVQKGEVGEARMALLAVMNEIQALAPASGQSPVKELFADYMAARNMAWPSAPAQLTVEAFQAFLTHFDSQKGELLRISKDLNMDSLPNGKDQYYRKIANVLGQRQSAYKKVGDFAMKSPPPDHLLSNREAYMMLFQRQIPRMFFHAAFGPSIAAHHAQQRVIPENLEIAEEALKQSEASKDPSFIWRKTNDAEKAIALCEGIEAAVRGEIDFSNLVADLPAMRTRMASEKKRAEVLFDKQIDSNKMPNEATWNAGDAPAVLKEVENAYKKTFPEDKILKILLRSEDFGERWESWWDRDTLYTAYFGYVKVAVAAKQPGGNCRVFFKWFRKELKANGEWTPLSFYQTIGSYQIREKNV